MDLSSKVSSVFLKFPHNPHFIGSLLQNCGPNILPYGPHNWLIRVYYIQTCKRIRKFSKQIVVYLKKFSTDSYEIHRAKPTHFDRFTKILLLLLLSYTICYLPPFLITSSFVILTLLEQSPPLGLRFVYFFSGLLIYVNGVANSCILFYRNKEARNYVLKWKTSS